MVQRPGHALRLAEGIAAVPGVSQQGQAPLRHGLKQADRRGIIQAEMLEVRVQLHAPQAQGQDAVQLLLHFGMVGMHGAKADEPVGVLRHRAGDKVVDGRHPLPGYSHRVHQVAGNPSLFSGAEQLAHGAVQVHGNVVEIADGSRCLQGNFVGIDVRVGVDDVHGSRRLLYTVHMFKNRAGSSLPHRVSGSNAQRYRISSRRGPLDTIWMGAPQAFSINSTYLRQFSGSSS